MSVRDHGIEALRKSAEEVTPGDSSEYRIRTTAVGTFTWSGLSTALITTTMMVGDTATKVPATPLSNRNSIEIHNLSDTITLYIGTSSGVTADRVNGTTSGKEIPGRSVWNIDITDGIELYGICASGESCQIKVTEVS